MERIAIETPGTRSEIFVGANWESVSELLPDNGVMIITDQNVGRIYGSKFPDFPVLTVLPGESSKQLNVIEDLAAKLLDAGIDRTGFILAIGGGVVCDLAGFLASIYMRGIRCGYVSSTLLAQVDASTGGKNGVNLGSSKNMLGNIRQPEFVICDPAMLVTLPEQEYLSGLAELIKTAVIGDAGLFNLLEENFMKISERDLEIMEVLVAKSVKFKADVVTEDERENGLRRILNFGHTFGHAIELKRKVKHGFAVASGMKIASYFSFYQGLIGIDERDRIINLLKRFSLIEDQHFSDDEILKLIMHDKKKSGSEIHFVFIQGLGKALVKKIPVTEVLDLYRRFRDKQ